MRGPRLETSSPFNNQLVQLFISLFCRLLKADRFHLLEIRLAHAVSASLAPPANPDQRPIPIKDVFPMSFACFPSLPFRTLDKRGAFHYFPNGKLFRIFLFPIFIKSAIEEEGK